MAADSFIWRATTLGARTSNTGDMVSFNEEPVPANGSSITQTEFEIKCAIANNSRPKGNLNELQDNGVDTVTVVVTGSIYNESTHAVPILVKKWGLEDKFNSAFPKGRFGLQLNDFPTFNLTPTSTIAYMLQDWRWVREGNFKGRVGFVATLRLNGNIGSSPYSW